MSKQWRQNKLLTLVEAAGTDSTVELCSCGLPLNPSGRTGVAGRGTLPKFGPNVKNVYVIVSRDIDESRMVCLQPKDTY